MTRGALACLVIAAIVRISGKRTLSWLTAFDLSVSVSMGSVLATTINLHGAHTRRQPPGRQ